MVYDGAFHGVHLDTVMRRHGLLAIAPTPRDNGTADKSGALVHLPGGKRARAFPLGPHQHETPSGPCVHQLAAIDGAVASIELDEAGDPVVVGWPSRGPVKRARRADGRYHFNVGYRVPCGQGHFDVWLSPNAAKPDDPRPHRIRIINEHDPDYPLLYPLRSDAEGAHSQFKRSLLTDRAMSLGWRRGLLDYYCFALLSNAMTEFTWIREAETPALTRRRARQWRTS